MNTKSPAPVQNPVQAATHPDPYSYYRDLVAQRPLYYDDSLKLWVASSASAVTAVLSSDLCRVRPTAEPVPKALLNSHAADIFQHLVRMNDGHAHTALKNSIFTALGAVDLAHFKHRSKHWAEALFARQEPRHNPMLLSEFAFRLPVYVIGDLLGIPSDQLNNVTGWVRDFVNYLSPLSGLEPIEGGKAASGHLLDLFRSLLVPSQCGIEG